MAIGDLTFRLQSLNGDTPPIPELKLVQRVGQGGYKRGAVRGIALSGYADSGSSLIQNPGGAEKYTYTLSLAVTEPEAQQLMAMIAYQKYNAEIGGSATPSTIRLIELVDEWRELRAEPPPHTRPLLTTQNTSWGWEYGFGVVRGILSVPGDSDYDHVGRVIQLGCTNLIQLSFQEV